MVMVGPLQGVHLSSCSGHQSDIENLAHCSWKIFLSDIYRSDLTWMHT